MPRQEVRKAAEESLNFLIEKMSGPAGVIRPVGNRGWCSRRYRADWDQQPLDVMKLALAGRVLSFFILSFYGETEMMRKLLGLVLIGMVVYLYVSEKNTYTPSFEKPLFPMLIGLTGGMIGGIFAVGGPFFVFYFLMRYKEKERYNANLQASFIIMNSFTIILHGIHGDFTGSFALYFLLGIVAVLAGVHIGLKWFERLPHTRIKKLASLIVLIAGMNLLVFS